MGALLPEAGHGVHSQTDDRGLRARIRRPRPALRA